MAFGAVENILVASGIASRLAMRREATSVVLAFHNVLGPGDAVMGDASLHMDGDAFGELLKEIARHAEFVTLNEAIGDQQSARGLRVAITFDDAYRGALTTGLSVLTTLDIPATVFLAPGLIGASSTWWDEAAQFRAGELMTTRREYWLDGPCAGRASAIRAEFPAPDGVLRPQSYQIADEQLVQRVAAQSLITFASHTWSHVNVAALAAAADSSDDIRRELIAELRRPMDWINARNLRCLNSLAYPYGRWNPQATRFVQEAGYDSAFRVDGGPLLRSHADNARFALPRINVPSAMKGAGVMVRVAGIRS